MRLRGNVVAMLVFTALAAGACGTGSTPSSTGSLTVTIGLITPLSGALAPYGLPERDGLRLAVDQVNAAGGFEVGSSHYRLKLEVLDDRSDQQSAVASGTQLLSDEHVNIIFGPTGPLASAVAQLAGPAQALQFTPSSSVNKFLGQAAYRNLFQTIPSLALRARTSAQSIKKFTPSAKTIAILGPMDINGQTIVPAAAKALTDAGYTVVDDSYPSGTPDLSPIMTKLASQKPDVIYTGWGSQDRAAQFRQLDAAGIGKGVTIFGYAMSAVECSGAGGRPCIANPFVSVDLTSASPAPNVQTFISAYAKATGQSSLPEQSQALLWYYDPLFLLVEAMKKAGTVADANKIADALQQVSYDGLEGKVSFDAGHTLVQPFAITFVANGQTTTQSFG